MEDNKWFRMKRTRTLVMAYQVGSGPLPDWVPENIGPRHFAVMVNEEGFCIRLMAPSVFENPVEKGYWILYDKFDRCWVCMPDCLFRDNAEPAFESKKKLVVDPLKLRDLAKDLDGFADEMERLRDENAELRKKAENNQTCYICEAKWVERVSGILQNKAMHASSPWLRDETLIRIPNEVLSDILKELKALGHSVT